MTGRNFGRILRRSFAEWNRHNAPQLGAALAYYVLLSAAPLLILLLAICALIFDKSAAEANLIGQVHQLGGGVAARMVQTLIDDATQPKTGIWASAIAALTLLFGASGVFIELRFALNTIWDVVVPPSSAFSALIVQRLIGFAAVLILGLLVVASLSLSAGLAIVGSYFSGRLPASSAVLGEIANYLVSVLALTVLFALVFKFVPDIRIDWRDSFAGALATAVLFQVGRLLLTVYFKTAAVGSAYGAAGSLVAFVVWTYYSAQIFFFGAVFTREYAASSRLASEHLSA